MSIFQAGERVIVTDGRFMGRHGEIVGTQDRDGIALVEVELDGCEGSELFRSSVLVKERIPRSQRMTGEWHHA